MLGLPEARDRVGMAAALITLVTLLRDGRNSRNIQWDTMWKTQTWYATMHDAGREYSPQSLLGGD